MKCKGAINLALGIAACLSFSILVILQMIQTNSLNLAMATRNYNDRYQHHVKNKVDQSMRLCEQNQYAKSLNMSLEEFGQDMDKWLSNKVTIEKDLVFKTNGHPHTHDRFQAFQEMGSCEQTCIGGACRRDVSKIACGVDTKNMEAPCVVYSVGGNNEWQFELDVLQKTPCEVHTFDCTGDIERFQVPEDPRLHFHHICLGTTNKKTETGQFWTLDQMTSTFNHTKIDLFKIDIEGYEFPMFQAWPNRNHKTYDTAVLPMQVLVEVHYQTHMPELSGHRKINWKFSTDMINLQEHLLKMGYAVINRDDNRRCFHCTELTLVRIRCPEESMMLAEIKEVA
jgi:hypothetical protein